MVLTVYGALKLEALKNFRLVCGQLGLDRIIGIAKVVVDDLTQAIAVGEVETALHRQILSKEEILGEIGDLITGRIQGRTDESDITVFDATGIGLQDLSVGALALENAAAAEQPGAIGTRVEF